MSRRGRVAVYSRPKPPGGQPTYRRRITTAEILPKEQGVWTPHGAPQPWHPALGRRATRTFGFEGQQGFPSGEPRAVGNRDSTLKGTHKISHTPETRAETVIWKEPGSDPPADLEESPREAGGNWHSPWGHRHWWQSFWGACSIL